jgi:GNAT superfamily N-acetyltransferase
MPAVIAIVTEADLPELLPLLRAYCDFYEVSPTDHDLLEMSRALIADPEHEGLQLIARDGAGTATGFATVLWTWSTLRAARIGIMNDLFVTPAARSGGVGEALVNACLEQTRDQGADQLTWQTAKENTRAQALYERVSAVREEWLDYWLPA